ncbi:MAG: nucleoside 2-deoxyribosyltransferase [Erysipelotrichaceae bacterium]
MKKIYLQTIDHLKVNGQQLYQQYSELAQQYGFQLLTMPDDYFQLTLDEERAQKLAQDKLQLIKESDIVVCDCNDFRCDNEPMGESALTLGIGYGLKKACYCYMSDVRVHSARYTGKTHLNSSGRVVDENGAFFENDPLNLMLYYSSKLVAGDFADCLKTIVKEQKDVCR